MLVGILAGVKQHMTYAPYMLGYLHTVLRELDAHCQSAVMNEALAL